MKAASSIGYMYKNSKESFRPVSQDHPDHFTTKHSLLNRNNSTEKYFNNPFPYYTNYNSAGGSTTSSHRSAFQEKNEMIKSLYNKKPRSELKMKIDRQKELTGIKKSVFEATSQDKRSQPKVNTDYPPTNINMYIYNINVNSGADKNQIKIPFDHFDIATLNNKIPKANALPSIVKKRTDGPSLSTNSMNQNENQQTDVNFFRNNNSIRQTKPPFISDTSITANLSNIIGNNSQQGKLKSGMARKKMEISGEIIENTPMSTRSNLVPITSKGNKNQDQEKVYDISFHFKKNSYGTKEAVLVQEFSYLQEQNSLFKEKMEDFSKTIENFTNNPNLLLFTLYDGHGGPEVAKFCKDNFPMVFGKLIGNLNNILSNYSGAEREKHLIENTELFLKTSFLKADDNSKVVKNMNAGSTAVVSFIIRDSDKRYLFTANLGDSTAYLINKDYAKKLSIDHKCTDPYEARRVMTAGGSILGNRVMGELMITRAYGDHKLKLFGVTAEPSINVRILGDNDRWLIIASDGIWDVVADSDLKEVCANVKSSEECVKALMKMAVYRGSRDNISCIAIRL